MKQHGAHQEYPHGALFRQLRERLDQRLQRRPETALGSGRLVFAAVGAAGQVVVDVVGSDAPEAEQRRRAQHDDQIEQPRQLEAVADDPERERGEHVAGGVEGLVGAHLTIEALAADDAERHRRERRREDGAGDTYQHLRARDDRHGREQRRCRTGDRDQDDAYGDDRALVPQPVDEHAGRRLRQHLGDVAERERRADLGGAPVHRRLKEEGHVRPHAVLDVGDREVERLQPAHAGRGAAARDRPGGSASARRSLIIGRARSQTRRVLRPRRVGRRRSHRRRRRHRTRDRRRRSDAADRRRGRPHRTARAGGGGPRRIGGDARSGHGAVRADRRRRRGRAIGQRRRDATGRMRVGRRRCRRPRRRWRNIGARNGRRDCGGVGGGGRRLGRDDHRDRQSGEGEQTAGPASSQSMAKVEAKDRHRETPLRMRSCRVRMARADRARRQINDLQARRRRRCGRSGHLRAPTCLLRGQRGGRSRALSLRGRGHARWPTTCVDDGMSLLERILSSPGDAP